MPADTLRKRPPISKILLIQTVMRSGKHGIHHVKLRKFLKIRLLMPLMLKDKKHDDCGNRHQQKYQQNLRGN